MLGFLTEAEAGVLVSCAIVSITLNPFLFRLIGPAERFAQSRPSLRRWFEARPVDDPPSKLVNASPANGSTVTPLWSSSMARSAGR